MEKSKITNDELEKCRSVVTGLSNYCNGKIVGQQHLKISLLVALMANGHILLESVPGLAKTTAAKAITDAMSAKFSKIQCTPDLLPSDIVGTQIFNYQKNQFETKIGPVYANLIILDEINRSSAKTQSAMLEVMQERKVSIAGETYSMPDLFLVIATQNPIEQEGTYLLAEAQTDRFLMKEIIDYPTIAEEVGILDKIESGEIEKSNPVTNVESILMLQDITKKVYIDQSIKKYISMIIDATRHAGDFIDPRLASYVEIGSSPRGSIALMNVAKAVALLNGRTFVTPDDVKFLSKNVLRHRIGLNYAAVADNINTEQIIDALLASINTP